MINSRLGLFSATPWSFGCESLHPWGHTLFRSYGVNLPSSFWMVHSHALGCSPHLLVSDFGTDARTHCQRLFLEVWDQSFAFGGKPPTYPHHPSALAFRLCHTTPRRPAYRFELAPSASWPTLLRSPGQYSVHGSTGILTCFPSATPLGLALGPD